MKKLRFAMFGLLMMLVSVSLFACGGGTKKIDKVSQNGLGNFYHISDAQTLAEDFSKMTLTVTYDDKTTETLTKGEFDIQEEDAQEDTQFVVDTDGLFAQREEESLTEKIYEIKCKIIGVEDTFDLGKVFVYDNEDEYFQMVSFTNPQFVTDRAVALGIEEGESAFYDRTQVHIVGDDNPFIFKPNAIFMNKVTNKHDVDLKTYGVNLTVTKIGTQSNGQDETVLEEGNNDYYTFDNNTFGIQFTAKAIGETFKISMLPKNFESIVEGTTWNPARMTFQVQDGWNAYDASDLARINIVPSTVKKNDWVYGVSSARITEAGGAMQHLDTFQAWKDYFAANKKIYGDNPQPINAIFFQKDIEVTKDDIPEKFFVSKTESAYAAGSIRDFSFIYAHHLDTDFTLNGNNFTLDVSKLPLGRTNTALNGYYFSKVDDATTRPTHSSVFAFLGKEKTKEGEKVEQEGAYNAPGNGYFKNLNATGNTGDVISGGDEDEVLLASQAEMLLKANSCHVEVDNCIAKNFMIAWYANQYRNQAKDATQRGALYLNHVKTYDCFNSAIFVYASTGLKVTNSELKRFGGPVVLTVSVTEDEDKNQQDEIYPSDITIDEATVLENYVCGDESWFILMGAGDIVTSLTGLVEPMMPVGNSILKDDAGKSYINVICLNMDKGYLKTSKKAYGSFQKGNTTKFDTDGLVLNTLYGKKPAEYQGQFPVFVSSDGQASIPTSQGRLSAFFSAANGSSLSDATKFTGEYLNMFYDGVGKGIGLTIGLNQTEVA